MSKFDILDFIDNTVKESCVLGYGSTPVEHPARSWTLDEKILYLQGLALVMGTEGENFADKKSFMNVLTQSMELDDEQMWESLESFAKQPDKETLLSFFAAFKQTIKTRIFLYDALSINCLDEKASEKGLKIIKKLSDQLEISEDTWQFVQALLSQIQANNWRDSLISLSSDLIELSLFRHLYEGVKLEELLLGKLVKIPRGSFMMGANDGRDSEKPAHQVEVKSFFIQEAPVTFAQWDFFVQVSGIEHLPDDRKWGRDSRPVINVSYEDITELFLPWLNRVTGKSFRLPCEAEWEYAARAGSTKNYSWGSDISPSQANYDKSGHNKTVPVKSYMPNMFGLYDMHGNVWEWMQDCWEGSYNGAPTNSRAYLKGDCDKRVLRGGSWHTDANFLRSAFRGWDSTYHRDSSYGFRLVCDY